MTTHGVLDRRVPDWRQESGVYWESWSRNGEVCIVGLDPPFPGGARLASCLTWLMRSFASRCRRTHDATGAFDAACTSPRMPSTLYMRMSLSFDLALRDPRMIRERVRRRGGDPDGCCWPALWLEGTFHDWLIGRDPFPPGGWPRGRLVVLAEERQVLVPARSVSLAASVRRAWANGLDAVAGVDGAAVAGLLGADERAFLLNMLVLVHTRPAANPQPRLPLEESYRRHEGLIAELSASAEAAGLPVAWHALWRLPPAMTWSEPGGKPWMRYPAVSFAAAVRPLQSSE
ncbi:MAG: hypothetical protein PHU25_15315 [Deltaproteobacteria bacterium]|nr:hypothetical protein [Deltaproteobacteria bacterium]